MKLCLYTIRGGIGYLRALKSSRLTEGPA